MTGYWVHFDDQGRASAFSGAYSPGAEWVEGVSDKTLITHRRVDGQWVEREPEPPAAPEDEAAQREAERQAAIEAREREVDAAIVASDAYRQFIRGEMTLTAYRDAAAKIAASIPMP